ncbi:MAG: alanine racemase [Oscillospiraceae bacterium]|nr:alanine racemase [Oscillospiraceae bacterium]
MIRALINKNALIHNVEQIKRLCPDKKIMAVVKANAYGHGIEAVVDCLYKHGIKSFAVSNIYEAETIREIAKGADILILSRTPSSYIERVIRNDFIQTISNVGNASVIQKHLKQNSGNRLRCHIKIDTGMTRFGVNTFDELDTIMAFSQLKPEAFYTHFSDADSIEIENREFTAKQQAQIQKFAEKYNMKYHAHNSAGALYHGELSGDMIRLGVSLYGYRPNTAFESPVKLKPVMTLKTDIVQIRDVPAGTPISYGRRYTADSYRRIAVVAAGYADGYSRRHSNRGKVIINGKLAPICGNVCMEYIMADITDIDNVKVGDEVTIYGDEDSGISVEDIADSLGTIPYEVTCAVAHRVERQLTIDS